MLVTVGNVAGKFESEPRSSTLKRGSRWTSLMNRLSTFSDTIGASMQSAWTEYFDNKLFSGLPPDRKRNTLAMTPENEKSIGEYERIWAQFTRFFEKKLPNKTKKSFLNSLIYLKHCQKFGFKKMFLTK